MKEYIFLYRRKIDDRDCCVYIKSNPIRFECDHYFGGIILSGSCYSHNHFADYENIDTILTREEYWQLIYFNKAIHDLGYGIKKGSKRYEKGIKLGKMIQPIYDKLQSNEANEFFKKIQNEEMEYLMNEYGLDEDDIKNILDNYYLDYRDRSIIGGVFKDVNELAEEEAWSMGIIQKDSITERYFDYERFGQDLLEEEQYLELDDGRVVILNY